MRETTKFLLLISLLFVVQILQGQNQFLKNFLSVEDGLSNNEVTSIVQDHDGFIWIGTRGGLNRYDGYDFKIFNQVPGDSNSLVNPSVESLFVDSKGNVWIGSKSGGISKYDPVKEEFTNLVSDYKTQSEIINTNRFLSFYEDKNGKIWMGSWMSGLIIYDQETNTSQHLLSENINTITESTNGKVWVGGSYGLYEFDISDYSFVLHEGTTTCQEILYDEKRNSIWMVGDSNIGVQKFNINSHVITNYRIRGTNANPEYDRFGYQSIYLDKEDRLWIGTWGTGFYLFDQLSESFSRYLIYPDNHATLNKDYDAVLDIFQDKSGNIWLGTNGGGVVVLTKKLKFNSVGYHPTVQKGLSNTRIMSVVDDRDGNLWLGTIGSGLFWSPDRENFYAVQNDFFLENRFFIVKYIYEDKEGNVWVSHSGQTFLAELENGVPMLRNAATKFGRNAFRDMAVSFAEKDNVLFYGTLQRGLVLMDKQDQYAVIKRIRKDNEGAALKSNRISTLLKDAKERVWVGTYNGLHIFNSADTSVVLVNEYFKISGELTGNIITTLDEDEQGNIWIGTPNGLNKLSETGTGEFKVEYFTDKDGLASNFVKGIAHDLNGNMWLSTNVGISKLETKENNHVVNYNETDGVRGKNFTEASVFRNAKGEIFFGGTDGLTFFNPDEIIATSDEHKPVFTQLSVLNQPVEIGKKYNSKVILEKSISLTKEIVLSYRQDKLEIQFSALDFESGGNNQYKFLLENYDKEWNFIGKRRFIVFNNLKPGEYILHVKSSNRHNIWNEEEATLRIIIRPPIWQTWYALLFYILVVIGIVSVIRWNAVKQVRLASNLEMEKLQHDQDQKLNEMKLRFFTNLSHEFRTPLTLILAPLKELLGQKDEYRLSGSAQHKIEIVQNNSLRLMKLVNQLLDFRKVESGNMKVFASETNLEEFVAEVCHPFGELAKINNIQFKLSLNLKTKNVWIDRDKLEVILNNLLSNAFKIVNENDKIEVALYEEEEEVLISVSDNGPGIPRTEINNIFDRFYRVGKSNGHGSSGIGLALAKRYAELHKGAISVVSKPNEHTEFTVSLPKGSEHFNSEEIVEYKELGFTRSEQILKSVVPIKYSTESKTEFSVLIVEDNKEVNDYLCSVLEPLYHVKTAYNGAEGFDLAKENIPNVIISDVMMPQMDGFEFCKQIRTHETTATIPFIFLTAKSDEQFRLLGAQLGADDFLSKPFDPNLLLEKVKNMLESRKKLQKQYSKSVRLGPSEIEISSGDEIFIEKVIATIEENLQNHKFTSDVLASEMNMSNSSLYRKLKSLTEASTAEFIRSIRIKRAAQLLADKQKTITEIAYEVGFNDVKHFRTVFQKHFSCSPSGYRSKL